MGASARTYRLGIAGIAAIAVGLHLGTLNNQLVYDDHYAIERNPTTEAPLDLVAHLRAGFWGPEYGERDAAWRPLVTLSYAWNRALHGVEPAGYHLANALLHGLVALLLVLLGRAYGLGPDYALAAGAVFAVHPVHVEAIAWAVGRADLMMTALGLAALLARERGRRGLALAALVAAMLCKEMALGLAPVLAWRELTADRGEAAPSRGVRALRVGLPLAAAGCYLVARRLALGTLGGASPGFLENPLVHAGSVARVFTAGELYLHALSLLAAPVTLVADYSYATLPPAAGPTVAGAAGLALLAGTFVAVVWSGRRAPPLSALLALWAGSYTVVSQLLPATLPMLFAERTLYLPSAGLCLALAWGAAAALARVGGRRARLAAAAAWLAVCGAFAARSAARVPDWADDATLMRVTAEDAPRNVKALASAAQELSRLGEPDAALAAIERALAVYDRAALPHEIAAMLHINAGRREAAREHLERAAALDYDQARYTATRCALLARFEPAAAVRDCEAATRAPFAGSDAWMFLAIARDRNGDPAAAELAFRRALAMEPAPPLTLVTNFGAFLARNGRFDEAEVLFERALELAPERADLRRTLDAVRRQQP